MKTPHKRVKRPAIPVFTIRFSEGRKVATKTEVPYGAFIPAVQKAKTYHDLNDLIGSEGLPLKSVRPLIDYLELTIEQLASLIGVTSRTLSRWEQESPIGVMASKTLLEVDRACKKGMDVFGNADQFKSWLRQKNIALGDLAPIDVLPEPYGVEQVEDALEALEYGNIM